MAATAKSTARHLHLVRAAQSAGEAFACPLPDDASSRWLTAHVGTTPFVLLAAGVVATAAALTLVF
jgi:hypothetical protein